MEETNSLKNMRANKSNQILYHLSSDRKQVPPPKGDYQRFEDKSKFTISVAISEE